MRKVFLLVLLALLALCLSACGAPLEAADLGAEHWAYDVMTRAYKDGWMEMDEDARIRPDEAVTAAEMAHALRAVCAGMQSAA